MTTEGGTQPTLADVLAALASIAQTQTQHGEALAAVAGKVADIETKVDGLTERVGAMEGTLDQVAQDVMAVKVDTGFIDRHIGDFQTWARHHQGNPNAHGNAA